MTVHSHSDAWYDQLSEAQEGYYYPWESVVPPFNGEDTYVEMVNSFLTRNVDVLDVGCGHGVKSRPSRK